MTTETAQEIANILTNGNQGAATELISMPVACIDAGHTVTLRNFGLSEFCGTENGSFEIQTPFGEEVSELIINRYPMMAQEITVPPIRNRVEVALELIEKKDADLAKAEALNEKLVAALEEIIAEKEQNENEPGINPNAPGPAGARGAFGFCANIARAALAEAKEEADSEKGK